MLAKAPSSPLALAAWLVQQPRLANRFRVAYQQLGAFSRSRRRKLLRHWGTSLAGAALALALSHTPPVYAARIPVGGGCTLINAITAANNDTASGGCTAGSGADTIILTGNTYTLTSVNNGKNGLPVITSEITIAGNGATIVRGASASSFRIFEVNKLGQLILNATTITGGNSSNGGGIYNAGSLTLSDSTLTGNTATFAGGGILNYRGTLTLTNSTLSGNAAEIGGGGLYNAHGALTLTDSTVSTNTSTIKGGGLVNYHGTPTVLNSTISGNAASRGGGIYNDHGALTLTNSTVSGNAASGGGGGVYNYGTLTLVHSLISGNTASNGQEIYNYHRPINAANFNLFGHSGETNAQAFSNFTPGASDLTATSNGTQATALAQILNPTLANNGGATKTHALVAGSPAIDAAGATGPATDQHGTARPQGAAVDIGAFEVKALNSRLAQTSVKVDAYNPTRVACGLADQLPTQTLTPKLHNNTGSTLTGLFFRVKILDYKVAQGGRTPALCNADTPGAGVGATITVAGSLASGGGLLQAFQVGLPVRAAYRLFVDVYSSSATAATTMNANQGSYLSSFEYEFDANGQLVNGPNMLFLPLVQR